MTLIFASVSGNTVIASSIHPMRSSTIAESASRGLEDTVAQESVALKPR